MSTHPELPSDITGLTKAAPLSRRTFMSAATAAAAGYTLAAGEVRADPIKTDSSGLTTGDEKVKVEGGEMPVYYAKPKGASNPPVILVAMEIFGIHEYIKDVARRLAKLGAFAVAPDYYFRKGDLTKIPDMKELMPLVNSKPDAELLADLDATVAWAKAQGGDTGRLGIVGFCRGGRTVWEYAAHSDQLKAGVAFYGSLVDPAAQKEHLAEKSDRARRGNEGAGARPLWRRGPGYSGQPGRGDEGGARRCRQDRGLQDLPRRRPCLPRRLPAQLSPRGGASRLG